MNPEFSAGNIALLDKFGDTSYQDQVIEIFLKLARAIMDKINVHDTRPRRMGHWPMCSQTMGIRNELLSRS